MTLSSKVLTTLAIGFFTCGCALAQGPCPGGGIASCVLSASIAPGTIAGDEAHNATVTVQAYVGNINQFNLEISDFAFSGTKTYCPGGVLFYGQGTNGGCKYLNVSPNHSLTVTYEFNGYNHGTSDMNGHVLLQSLYDVDPGQTVNVTVTPIQDPSVPVPQTTDGPSECTDNGQSSCGSPINFANGNTWISQTDYSVPGLGGGLTLTRTWNSLWSLMQPLEQAGIFGDSWRSNLEERIQMQNSTTVKYWKGDGGALYYSYNAATGFWVLTAPADDQTTLSYNSSTSIWTISLKNGTKKNFNYPGYLTSIVDRNSNTTTINVDSANQNRIATVTDPAGLVLTFNYANSSFPRLCTSISDSVGTVATYTYDTATGRLTQVAYNDPSGTQYNFNYTDPNSNTLISSVVDSQSKTLEAHTYDSQRRGKTSQQANGVNLVTVTYPTGSPYGVNVANSYGDTTTVYFATVAQRQYITQTFGSNQPCSTCGFLGGIFAGLNGNSAYFQTVSDPNGNTSYLTYDTLGNLTARTQPEGNGSTSITGYDTWQYAYNSFGEVLTAIDPLNHQTTNQYDAKGNLLTVTTPSPDGVIAPSVTTFTPNAQGQVTQVKDPLLNKTTITYCPTGNSTCPYGMINYITNAKGNKTTYAYDARRNRTSLTDPASKVTQFQYDSMNRLTLITYPTSPATTVQIHYDWRGRRDYVIDQNAQKTTYGYDDADRLTSVTDAQSPTPGVTTYAYNTESNLTDIYDGNQNHTQFTYFSGDFFQKTTFPSGYYETYNWNLFNQPTSKTDRNGQQILYSYDFQNRLYKRTYPDSSTVVSTYDPAGRLTQVTDPSGTYTFGYDNMDRLTSAATNYAFDSAGAYTVSYGYDAASNRTSMTDPQTLPTIYGYDTLNRLSTLNFNNQSTPFGFGYDTVSRRSSLTRPNGITTSYAYDAVSRLTSILHKLGTTTLDGATYTYDNAGNRKTRTDKRTNATLTYGYDNIYQLLSAKQGSTTKETYTYDAVGNRLSSLGVSPYTYNTSNELTGIPGLTYTYDNNGNTKTKSNGTQYTWDYENQLTQIVLPGTGGTVNFKYDPFGRRVQKSLTQGSTTTTDYLYDGRNSLEELDQSGNVLARYSQGPSVVRHAD